MPPMPSIVYLVGSPASGKRTVGQALSDLTGAALIDNHLINDPIFKAYGADGVTPLPKWVGDFVHQVRDATMATAARAVPTLSHIFTNYLSGDPAEGRYVTQMRELATRRGAQFVPVWLTCPEDELLRRVVLPNRAVRQKMQDPEGLKRLLHTDGVLPAPSDALVLDTSTMEPDESAERIRDHAGMALS